MAEGRLPNFRGYGGRKLSGNHRRPGYTFLASWDKTAMVRLVTPVAMAEEQARAKLGEKTPKQPVGKRSKAISSHGGERQRPIKGQRKKQTNPIKGSRTVCGGRSTQAKLYKPAKRTVPKKSIHNIPRSHPDNFSY